MSIYKVGSPDPVSVKKMIVEPRELEVEHVGATKLKIKFTSPHEPVTVEMTDTEGNVVDLAKLNIQAIELKISVDDLITQVHITHALFPDYSEK